MPSVRLKGDRGGHSDPVDGAPSARAPWGGLKPLLKGSDMDLPAGSHSAGASSASGSSRSSTRGEGIHGRHDCDQRRTVDLAGEVFSEDMAF